MRAIVVLGSLMLTCGLASAGGEPTPRAGKAKAAIPPGSGSEVRVAQNCGYFAILGCFKTRGEALDWNARIDQGHVINTSSDAYPNFRPGYFCVAAGPTAENRARAIAGGWRRVIPDAYVKNSC